MTRSALDISRQSTAVARCKRPMFPVRSASAARRARARPRQARRVPGTRSSRRIVARRVATSSSDRLARNRSRSSVRRLSVEDQRTRDAALDLTPFPQRVRLPEGHAQQDGGVDVRDHRCDCRVSSKTCTTSIWTSTASAARRDSARARPRPACESAAHWRRGPGRSRRRASPDRAPRLSHRVGRRGRYSLSRAFSSAILTAFMTSL